MSLFQSSVQKQYRALQDSKVIKQQFKKFQKYFHDAERQKNISSSKEEQFQEGFLRELFVDVLGYTINPNKNFNLTTEFKNLSNAQKADGAILSNGNAVAVIELKGTKTKDLESVRKQAFDYKANHTHCSYVITSNFETLRFYIDNAVAYEEFNLFTLTEDEFSLLWLCLARENILSDLPRKIKNESLINEEKITKTLYADYSLFKRELYRDLVKRNVRNALFREMLATDELEQENRSFKRTLFKVSQKLIDRFLFIFFAEDRGLIPSNTTAEILARWETLKEMDAEEPLYSGFKKFFNYLDTGRKETNTAKEIFSYNGGLFKPDPILDSLLIDDDLLSRHTRNLSRYDYESQVSVNILGHIFENSLNEIESINAEIDGIQFDKQKTKRKTDGVFYTPPYITKYIVDNTVGRLCEEKKEHIGIVEDEFFKDRKRRRKETIDRLRGQLTEYRVWLLDLTICDPACGSGAFLNEALDFLIREHDYIDMLEAKLLERGQSMQLLLSNIENTILEKNIYGVDINEESVEIAKLSLWLRSAQPRRKLNNLNNNIKCGNSLIDNRAVAGEKAFKWKEEFPEIFAKGGFDVIVGNPPWGAKLEQMEARYLVEKYPVIPTKIKDTYLYFTLLALALVKSEGAVGIIIPNTWLLINNAKNFRRELLSKKLITVIDHGDGVFDDAIVESTTLILKNEFSNDSDFCETIREKKGVIVTESRIEKSVWISDDLHRISIDVDSIFLSIMKRLSSFTERFEENCEIIFGIKPYQVGHGVPAQTQDDVDCRIFHSIKDNGEGWYPLVTGTDVNRYSLTFHNDAYIKYGKWLMYASNATKIKKPKLLLRRTSSDLRLVYDENQYYPQNSLFILTSEKHNLLYLMALMNSKLFNYLYKNMLPQQGKVFAEVKPSIIKSMPILPIEQEVEKEFIKNSSLIMKGKESLNVLVDRVTRYILSKYPAEKISKKLQNWYGLTNQEFLKELGHHILLSKEPKLTKATEIEWMEFFEIKKSEVLVVCQQIEELDGIIDKVIYELYGLTDEEIRIIEGSI